LKTSDGYTRSNTQALTTAKVKLSKNDAALVNKNCTKASCVSTHGMYRVFLASSAVAIPWAVVRVGGGYGLSSVWKEYNVVSTKQWNSIFIDSDKLEVDLVQNNGVATTFLALPISMVDLKHSSALPSDRCYRRPSTLSTADLDDALAG
jgi:hypothetical protein